LIAFLVKRIKKSPAGFAGLFAALAMSGAQLQTSPHRANNNNADNVGKVYVGVARHLVHTLRVRISKPSRAVKTKFRAAVKFRQY
jgi:hypothetical protein